MYRGTYKIEKDFVIADTKIWNKKEKDWQKIKIPKKEFDRLESHFSFWYFHNTRTIVFSYKNRIAYAYFKRDTFGNLRFRDADYAYSEGGEEKDKQYEENLKKLIDELNKELNNV
jgi:hypothetical protein